MTIGERIKKARIDQNMSSTELAKRLGKSQTSITEIEKNRSVKQLEQLKRICEILNVSADEILGLNEKEHS